MKLERIAQSFSICKLKNASQVDFSEPFLFLSKTDEELSLVCRTQAVPADTIARDDGWRAFRIQGTLDFSMTGVLSKLSTLLAAQDIGIFAISTYDTDYILTKAQSYEKACAVLEQSGYEMVTLA